MVTSAPNTTKLPPSPPTQNRINTTTACAITSCGNPSRIPAACVNLAPVKRIESSRSRGTPSICELEVSSCGMLASALARGEGCMVCRRLGAAMCVVVVES